MPSHWPHAAPTHCSTFVKNRGNSAMYPLSCRWLGDRELCLQRRWVGSVFALGGGISLGRVREQLVLLQVRKQNRGCFGGCG